MNCSCILLLFLGDGIWDTKVPSLNVLRIHYFS